MRFFKKFLKNLWNCILIVFFLALGVAASLAPTYLAATFNKCQMALAVSYLWSSISCFNYYLAGYKEW